MKWLSSSHKCCCHHGWWKYQETFSLTCNFVNTHLRWVSCICLLSMRCNESTSMFIIVIFWFGVQLKIAYFLFHTILREKRKTSSWQFEHVHKIVWKKVFATLKINALCFFSFSWRQTTLYINKNWSHIAIISQCKALFLIFYITNLKINSWLERNQEEQNCHHTTHVQNLEAFYSFPLHFSAALAFHVCSLEVSGTSTTNMEI